MVTLTRANLTGSVWTLMQGLNSTLTITLDAYQQMQTLPEMDAALTNVVQAIIVYATKNKLL